MGKVLWTEDGEQSHKNHVGCMPRIFHALDYQLWHSNVKKIFPRKHDAVVQRAKRNRRHKRISDGEDPFKASKLLDRETSHILVDQSHRKTKATQKRSIKSRIKSLVSEGDTLKNDNAKEQDRNVVPSPRLQRKNSIHHLETNEWVHVHPNIFFPENVTENVTSHEIKDPQDNLETFEVDIEKSVKVLQDDSWVADTKAKLTKSGSFPAAFKSRSRNLRPAKLEDKLNEFYTVSKLENSNSHDDHNLMRIRRVSSLNESADRYARLIDFSVGKEAYLRPSRSLKLTNGSDNLLSSQEHSFFRRNHTLSRFDNPNQESRDSYLVRSASQNEKHPVSLLLRMEKEAELSSTENHECSSEKMEKSDNYEHLLTINVNVNSPELGEDERMLTIEEDSLQDEIESQFQISEDFKSTSKDNLENGINKHTESTIKCSQDEDDFSYVKQILERSGFIKNGFQQAWYSSNQPLDPFVFQEMESQYHHDPEHFDGDFNELSHRLLLFELVDDVLVSMFERSSTYYLKAFSSSCHIRAAPSGAVVLDEVWKHVSRLLNLKAGMEKSINDIVAHDLGSDDGWMNLQLDSECVALHLEDLILDQVLEEVV